MGGRLLGAGAVVALVVGTSAWAADKTAEKQVRTPQPWVTMSLGSLGVPGIPQSFLQVGSSMLTLDIVDDTHLLVTFSSRGLVPRDASDSPGEEPRMVAAELVELPTGRVLARADWKMHDHGRYLWRLGKGRFVVRTNHELFALTPEARLHEEDPLQLSKLPGREGTPLSVAISPEKSIMTVETLAPSRKTDAAMATQGAVVVAEPQKVIMVDFFRLSGGDAPGVPLTVRGAGVVRSSEPILLPMDGDGYLWPDDAGHGRWPVSFNEFGGREVKIGRVDSSCAPRLQMVSRFEFLAFTCRGTEARAHVQSYGMDGHETWEDNLGGTYGAPELAYAPEAGRFALSRIISPTGDTLLGAAIPEGATQEVRIYQTESGDVLLKVPTSPVMRMSENFDLSEDGLVAAVIDAGMIQVYKLPPPSAKDRKDLEEARSFSPPVSDAQVSFAKLVKPENGGESAPAATDVASAASAPGGTAPAPGLAKKVDVAETSSAGAPGAAGGKAAEAAGDHAVAATVPAAEPGAKQGAGDAAGDGDSAGAGRRRPPTLLQPGESVEKVKAPTTQQSSR